MSAAAIPLLLRLALRRRANGACEYCRLHQDDSLLPHEPDHIISAQHGGLATAENLALACFDCNRLKGPNLSSVDPATGAVERLFDPRNDAWGEHFRFERARIVPLTAKGRATAALLRLNSRERLIQREALLTSGSYPV